MAQALLISKESGPFHLRQYIAEWEDEEQSIRTYGYLLKNLGRYMDGYRSCDNGRPSAEPILLSDLGIAEFEEYCPESWSGSNKHNLLCGIKNNLRWQGIADHPLLKHSIKTKHRKAKPQRFLAPDDYQTLLQVAATTGYKAWRNRNVAILVTLWQTLVRATELCSIDLGYVYLNRRMLEVETKATNAQR